ncbi:MAG: hypothetical protein EBW87_04880 [Burkholderiaceae bacterium]|jgi:hypothetical protein|nr:hypothetical protein [Burkholderiaceae bacterium]
MADAELTAKLKVDNEVPQAMDKAKAATVSFEKQVADIGKKFSTAFKDIALGFIAPMVIVQNLIGFISQAMDQARRDAQEGFDLIAKGESKFTNSQQSKKASFVQYMLAQQEEEQKVKAGAQKIYEGFLNSPQGKKIFEEFAPRFSPEGEPNMFTIPTMASNKEVRDAIEKYFKESPEFKDFTKPSTEAKPTSTYSAPQGVNAVVGMGANAALDAMNAQLEEQRKQTSLLEQIANPGGIPDNFTGDRTAPSRSK